MAPWIALTVQAACCAGAWCAAYVCVRAGRRSAARNAATRASLRTTEETLHRIGWCTDNPAICHLAAARRRST